MKKKILLSALLLLALSGCRLTPRETEKENVASINLSAPETEENIEKKEADFSRGDLLTMFEEINNEEIENFLYDDYNKDGIHEAFVLTKAEDKHNLWFFQGKECELAGEAVEGVKPLETDILTFSTRDYLLLQQVKEKKRNTIVYGVDNANKVFETNISRKGYVTKTASGEIWLRPGADAKANPEKAESTTYYLYYVFDEGFREYGAIPIGMEQFLEFEGAQKILDDLAAEYPEYELEFSFLYRLNHCIHVNITLKQAENTEYKNMTLIYDDYQVMRNSEKLADGRAEIAYMLDGATFPTAFKHPKKNNAQENGG